MVEGKTFTVGGRGKSLFRGLNAQKILKANTEINMKVSIIAVLRLHVNKPFRPVARQARLEGAKILGWGFLTWPNV